jgi:hypothetical protein
VRSLTAVLTVLLLAGCAGNQKPDTSQLSPVGKRDFQTLQFVQGVNDVTLTVIALNKQGQLSDARTATILTINKQILDFLEANPQGTRAQVFTAIKNARDALPAPVDSVIAEWLSKIVDLLLEVPA